MNLTTKEKIELLEKVRMSLLQDLKTYNYRQGICYLLQQHTGFLTNSIENIVPELLEYKPVDAGRYWFKINKEGTEKRIKIIEKTIQDLENKIPKKEIVSVYFKCKPENIKLVFIDGQYYNSHNAMNIRLGVDKQFIKQNPELFEIEYKEESFAFDNTKSFDEELKRLEAWVKNKNKNYVRNSSKIFYLTTNKNDDLEIDFFSGKLEFIFRYLIPKFYCREDVLLCQEQLNLSENTELKNYLLNKLK